MSYLSRLDDYFKYCTSKNYSILSFGSYKKYKSYKELEAKRIENLNKLNKGFATLFDTPEVLSAHPDFKSKKWN